jgi:predicted GTPase
MVVNKLEQKVFTDKVYEYLNECYALGFEDVFPLSAKQGEGMELLMEEITKRIKKQETTKNHEDD